MKKSTLIICAVLTTFSLAAYGFINRSQHQTAQNETSCSKPNYLVDNILFTPNIQKGPDLVYAVEPRFMTRITKEDLYNAESIIDILPEKSTRDMVSYQSVEVAVLGDDGGVSEFGKGDELNQTQKRLLRSTDYSTNIHISAYCKYKNDYTGGLEDYHIVYYMTVIPETEAEYADGFESIIEYLKENSKEETALVNKDQLKPGKVSFTITQKGTIEDIKLDATCGYPSVDDTMKELLNTLPKKWKPAKNAKGELVDQELILFFGTKGC